MADPRSISDRLAAIGIRHEPAPPHVGGRILFHNETGLCIGHRFAHEACHLLESAFVVATKEEA